jgi:membrane protease YdiL (CAAX protease family)
MHRIEQNNAKFHALQNLTRYILQPTVVKKPLQISFSSRIEIVFQYLTVNLVFQLILGGAITVLLFLVDSRLGTTTTNELATFVQSSSYWELLLIGGILLPLTEEIGFRLPLHFHPVSLGISIVYILILLHSILSSQSSSFFESNNLIMMGIFVSIGSICTLLFFLKRVSVETFWHTHFRWIYYGFAFLFGIMHISNLSSPSLWIYFLSPLIILPQFISGLVMGYIRLQFGFFWGFAFHAIWNTALLSLAYVAYAFLTL